MVPATDPTAQPRETNHTPSLTRSPKGQFDAQAAQRALKAGDEEALVAALMTTKWGKAGYQAQVTIEGALGPGTDVLELQAQSAVRIVASASSSFLHGCSRPDVGVCRLLCYRRASKDSAEVSDSG